MRRFIYLDTNTLNSYIAQMYDGLVQSQSNEKYNKSSNSKKRKFISGLTGGFAAKIFGKGIEVSPNMTFEHFKSVADENTVKEVKTKIVHDNAFNQFMEYLRENDKLHGKKIGDFIHIQDEF